ncbi:MAG: hypothetical protein QF721_04995 [Verrucomicrobiota bacterium]|nr:hypothetical protein [Verrucomicrobiota bacterium]
MKLLIMAMALTQGVPFVLAQPSKAILNVDNNGFVGDGKFTIALNFNEPFRWENTKFESIKTFPMRGGNKMPHTICFKSNNNVSWRQTDVVFSGTFNLKETSAKDLLNQYIDKHGGFGVRTWSIDNNGNLKSFNERTGQYEMLAPRQFSEEYGLDFQSDEYTVEASISGYLVEIIGVFDHETNLLNFDTLDYVPLFDIPRFTIEKSHDLQRWIKVKLSDSLPKEYHWPHELNIELNLEPKNNAFYRVKIGAE